MPLSDQDRNAITNTLLADINNIPVGTAQGFPWLIKGLQAVLNNAFRRENFPREHQLMADKIEYIVNYMSPDFGAVYPENRNEFLKLCRSLIQERIEFFSNLSAKKQIEYIKTQNQYHRTVQANQQIMQYKRDMEGVRKRIPGLQGVENGYLRFGSPVRNFFGISFYTREPAREELALLPVHWAIYTAVHMAVNHYFGRNPIGLVHGGWKSRRRINDLKQKFSHPILDLLSNLKFLDEHFKESQSGMREKSFDKLLIDYLKWIKLFADKFTCYNTLEGRQRLLSFAVNGNCLFFSDLFTTSREKIAENRQEREIMKIIIQELINEQSDQGNTPVQGFQI